MTNDEMRIAIAEACGWKWARHADNEWWFTPPEDLDKFRPEWAAVNVFSTLPRGERVAGVIGSAKGRLPDYLNDLNAMHEAERQLHKSHDNAQLYCRELQAVVYKTKHSGTEIGFQLINATAAQRAKAFVKTFGKRRDA